MRSDRKNSSRFRICLVAGLLCNALIINIYKTIRVDVATFEEWIVWGISSVVTISLVFWIATPAQRDNMDKQGRTQSID